jgi:hypothetical protein
MRGRSAVSEESSNPWRWIAGVLLGVEALWWAGNTAVSATMFGESPTAELLTVIPVAFMTLTLLAIFLLVQAPRGGVWMGLTLQVLMLAEAVVFAFMSFVALFVAVPLAVVTAVCLAAAWPRSAVR